MTIPNDALDFIGQIGNFTLQSALVSPSGLVGLALPWKSSIRNCKCSWQSFVVLHLLCFRYGDMMTVSLGSRQTVYLNTEEVIREAFVKHGHSFAGRPRDMFWMKELCDGIGNDTKFQFLFNDFDVSFLMF